MSGEVVAGAITENVLSRLSDALLNRRFQDLAVSDKRCLGLVESKFNRLVEFGGCMMSEAPQKN